MADKQIIDAMWDDSPVDVSTEVNFIWSIANKLRGPYRSDKYKDVIIPMTIIRRFECALAPTKQKVVEQFKANPNFPAKAMYRISGFQFYNTSEFDLAELVNDADHIAANFKSYLQGFSANVLEILMSKERGLNFGEEIDKMDKNNRLLSVIKAFSELDLNPRTIDNVKMGYIFEELIRKFSENAEAGDLILTLGCGDIYKCARMIRSQVSCWPKAATISSMMAKSSLYWIRPAARAVCSPLAIISSSVIILLPMCDCSGRRSTRSLMPCALRRCSLRVRMLKISAIRTL